MMNKKAVNDGCDAFICENVPREFLGKKFTAVTGYMLRNIVGEYLLVPVALDKCDTSKVSVLNETGAFLWEKLKEAKSFSQLTNDMTQEFDVSPGQACEDVKDFLNILSENKLIHVETEVM